MSIAWVRANAAGGYRVQASPFHSRRALRGACLQLAAGCAFLIGVGVARGGSSGSIPLALLLALAGLAVMSGAAWLYKYGARLRQPTAAELLAVDRRAPILLLRAFHRDAAVIPRPLDLGASELASRASLTFEEALVELLAPLGPPVAIGRPGEPVPPMGAARTYVADDTWQAEVRRLADAASLVVVIADATTGLQWEMAEVIKPILHRTLVVIPPTLLGAQGKRTAEWYAEWEVLRSQASFLPTIDDRVAAIRFDAQGKPELIHATSARAQHQLRAIAKAVETLGRAAPPAPAETKIKTWVMPAVFYVIWFLVLPYALALVVLAMLLKTLAFDRAALVTVIVIAAVFLLAWNERWYLPGARLCGLAGVPTRSRPRRLVPPIAIAVVVALFFRTFVMEAYKIPSSSMLPTLEVGDMIFIKKLGSLIAQHPRRGEVVVFVYPKDPAKDFIKRVIAVEGDVVEVQRSQVRVNDRAVSRVAAGLGAWRETLDGATFTTLDDPMGCHGSAADYPPTKVPTGHVFVMGDNRCDSHDSRHWGFVPVRNIKGNAMFTWLSVGPDGLRWARVLRGVN